MARTLASSATMERVAVLCRASAAATVVVLQGVRNMREPKPPAVVSHQRASLALGTLVAIGVSLLLRFGQRPTSTLAGLPLYEWPLLAVLVFGGLPLVYELLVKLLRREFGSDLLAGLSIITSIVLGEYLAGALVVLMLSGGE